MNLEKLLGSLMQSGLSGPMLGKHGISKKKGKHGGGLGSMASRAVFSKGGLSLLAGIGIAAYEHYRERQQQAGGGPPTGGAASPPPFQRPAAPPPFGTAGAHPIASPIDADLILTAMVAAARADGVLDAEERAALADYLRQSGADS